MSAKLLKFVDKSPLPGSAALIEYEHYDGSIFRSGGGLKTVTTRIGIFFDGQLIEVSKIKWLGLSKGDVLFRYELGDLELELNKLPGFDFAKTALTLPEAVVRIALENKHPDEFIRMLKVYLRAGKKAG